MLRGSEVVNQMSTNLQRNGFLPYDRATPGKKSSEGLTLHESLRIVINMKPEDSYYMYWEWPTLKNSLIAFWDEMDMAATRVLGRTTTAIAFAARDSTTIGDIEELLGAADCERISPFPTIHRRPAKSESQVRFVGKLLGACLQTMGIVAVNAQIPFSEVMGQFANDEWSDEDLLVQMDQVCVGLGLRIEDLTKPAPVVLMRALGFAYQVTSKSRETDDQGLYSLSQFLHETDETDPWVGFSDREALTRLLAIAPENADSSRLAIAKFLGE